MIDRQNAILLKFKELYGTSEGVGVTRAPGRVNIIGGHTDYNEGFVLPIAIARDTVVAFKPNGPISPLVRTALDDVVTTGHYWQRTRSGEFRIVDDRLRDFTEAALGANQITLTAPGTTDWPPVTFDLSELRPVLERMTCPVVGGG